MTATVTKKMVELYILGVLSPERRRQVEDAFDASPMVQEWFLDHDELPDHVREEAELAELRERSAEDRWRMSNDLDRAVLAFAEVHAFGEDDLEEYSSEDPTRAQLVELVLAASSETRGHRSTHVVPPRDLESLASACKKMDFTEALAAAPPESPAFATGPASEDWYGQDGDAVFVNCDEPTIPAGLCWLGLFEADGTVTMHLPKLEFIYEKWVWSESITDILGGRRPVSPVNTFVLPATPETRSAFETDEVRGFIRKLPKESEQRKRAEAFLQMGTSADDQSTIPNQ